MRVVAEVVIVAATLLFLASMGGGMLFTWWLLVPLHWWAARDSGPVATGAWAFLAAASMWETSWMATYAATSNESMSTVVGLVVFAATGVSFTAARARAAGLA